MSRVQLKPVTGPTHQLRVHPMSLGYPILGNVLYAPPESPHAPVRGVDRLHPPAPGDPHEFESPVPF